MTDTMLFGVLKMPFQMAMSDEISRIQFYARVQELVGRFEAPQQAEPVAWDKPSASFNEWWDSYRYDPANPFSEGSAAYWAWAGWQAAQRPWVGLTDEDFLEACQLAEHGNYLVAFQRIQTKLKEKNT